MGFSFVLFFLFLFFLRRHPHSKGLFVKHAISCALFFFFTERFKFIISLKRKKNVGTHVFVVWWKVGCGLLTELTCSLECLH